MQTLQSFISRKLLDLSFHVPKLSTSKTEFIFLLSSHLFLSTFLFLFLHYHPFSPLELKPEKTWMFFIFFSTVSQLPNSHDFSGHVSELIVFIFIATIVITFSLSLPQNPLEHSAPQIV